jgi:glycosyltransferase involved in cell wall biosynthesis
VGGLTSRPPDSELIVVADGALDDCSKVVAACGGRVLCIEGPSGPAVARNRGAELARGDVLVFVDADVVVAPDALTRIGECFRTHPGIDAVFGSYDDCPAAPNFVSQYKNLAHAIVHRASGNVATTFWAGLGAVRQRAFRAVGGFDERFPRPCIEDIDLGYRLHADGFAIRLDHEIRGCHLKRWTFASLLASDVLDRGIPWTQLIMRSKRVHSDLNLKSAYRASVALAYLLLAIPVLSMWSAWWILAAIPILATLYVLNRRFYRAFAALRGPGFAVRVLPLHYLYHLYNGVSFCAGTVLYGAVRIWGAKPPMALPITPWTGRATAAWDTVPAVDPARAGVE